MSSKKMVILEIGDILKQISKEKNLSTELVIKTLQDGLVAAAKKYLRTMDHIEATYDEKTGVISVIRKKKVVETVENEDEEMTLEEALELKADIKIGEEYIEPIDFSLFGRNPIQVAKQIIIQRVREAEREIIYEEFKERVGELVTGTIQQIDKGDVLVNIGKTGAIIPRREQIPRERYRQGDTIRAYIYRVQNTSKAPIVSLSRTHPEFVTRLFELEVPEIYDKIVEIKGVSREAGIKSKVAVVSHDEKVDPVGACVGMKGNRIQSIVRELNNEKIDIVSWSTEFPLFVRRAISPAKALDILDEEEGRPVVVVLEQDQLSLAIGKGGVNAKLASRLIGREIDLYSREEWAEEKAAREKRLAEGGSPAANAEVKSSSAGVAENSDPAAEGEIPATAEHKESEINDDTTKQERAAQDSPAEEEEITDK